MADHHGLRDHIRYIALALVLGLAWQPILLAWTRVAGAVAPAEFVGAGDALNMAIFAGLNLLVALLLRTPIRVGALPVVALAVYGLGAALFLPTSFLVNDHGLLVQRPWEFLVLCSKGAMLGIFGATLLLPFGMLYALLVTWILRSSERAGESKRRPVAGATEVP